MHSLHFFPFAFGLGSFTSLSFIMPVFGENAFWATGGHCDTLTGWLSGGAVSLNTSKGEIQSWTGLLCLVTVAKL